MSNWPGPVNVDLLGLKVNLDSLSQCNESGAGGEGRRVP